MYLMEAVIVKNIVKSCYKKDIYNGNGLGRRCPFANYDLDNNVDTIKFIYWCRLGCFSFGADDFDSGYDYSDYKKRLCRRRHEECVLEEVKC